MLKLFSVPQSFHGKVVTILPEFSRRKRPNNIPCFCSGSNNTIHYLCLKFQQPTKCYLNCIGYKIYSQLFAELITVLAAKAMEDA